MKRKIISGLVLLITLFNLGFSVNAANDDENNDIPDYTTLREVDKGTYNEYRYYMVREYFKLKEYFDLNGTIDKTKAGSLFKYAKTGFNYLPDNLVNERYLNDLSIAVQRGIKTPNSEVNYLDIVEKLRAYLEDVNIQAMKGTITATPRTGNAPLTTTLRGKITDPTGTVIPNSNYIWWITKGGQKTVIGKGASINYTIKEEGRFTVFLGVKSNHKNNAGYNDVISFQSSTNIEVKEKVASVFIKVNSKSLREDDEIKFTPDEANYGLLFDATSSTPAGGAKFTRTEWDFGNGITRKYDGSPKLERVVYGREGSFTVKLKLQTNELNSIERKFVVFVHDPIATIRADKTEGYIGDKFTFSTESDLDEDKLSYSWNIIDIDNDKIIKQTNGSVFSYMFSTKGRFNIQLKVKDASGEEDVDTEVIHINSRAPIAEYTYTIPNKNKPNTVLLDGTRSYDPDYSDTGNLKYVWTVDGEIVTLENLDSKGAIGYYTFDSVGEHAVVLEVSDTEDMTGAKSQKVKVESILSVDLFTFPRVVQRGGFIKFVANSENANYYEWDFGDGEKKSGASDKIDHIYNKSGIFQVRLSVKDQDGNKNEVTKSVYVGESQSPLAIISPTFGGSDAPMYNNSACGEGAYIVDRTKTVTFRGNESINVNGEISGLSYSWKLGNDKYVTTESAAYKFSELGCFPIKLTVKSDNGKTATTQTYVKVENIKPTLTSLQVAVQDDTTDPVIVGVTALGAKDPDGVIQSYLWYYYTDTDTDPQDFRMTSTSSTTFVLPKISGNYYFVVVMRDNNDVRITSEEISGAKTFITLAGDNVNTPLITLEANKNNVNVGDEVIFTTNVKNVLGQNIGKNAKYSWDFDGDGFYDKETTAGTITYNYSKSGTFYAKVRVDYKGLTNVRNIEVNVSNVLTPDFEYTSIGNKYVFYNTSSGNYDSIVWDMGDGNKVYDTDSFVYTFEDGKTTNNVNLKISEGTNVKDKTKEVVKNVKNMLEISKKDGIVIFSNPEIKDDKISLDKETQKVFIYTGLSKGNPKYYGVDFDTSVDSDLNGTKDDDIDNVSLPSYNDGGVVEITLTKNKTQTFRVVLLDGDKKTIESQDVTIEKKYIKEEEINLDEVTFSGATTEEKAKIEKLKSLVQSLPQENRLSGMQYVQKLQENWNYPTEKTKVILDFEKFIDGLSLSNEEEVVSLLESFLVEGQQDQSVRNMAYNVVKNLIPKELEGYEDIIKDLDTIKSKPSDIETNKTLGKEILELIKDTSLISNEDKVIIKTQLQVLIYGGVDKIPEEVKTEVKAEDGSGNKVIGLLSGTVKFIGIFFGLLLLIVLGFFIWFKISNKNPNQGFQDFIIEKTSFDKEHKKTNDLINNTDILSSVEEVKEEEKPYIPKVEEKKDVFAEVSSSTGEVKTEESIPDWLKSSTSSLEDNISSPVVEEVKEESHFEEVNTFEEPKVVEENVPDWLKGGLSATDSFEEVKEESKAEETFSENTSIEEITEVEEENVPDWLKGSLGTTPKVEEKTEEVTEEPKVEEVPEVVETKIDETEVPDWLKGSLGTTPKVEEKTEEVTEEPKVEEVPEVVETKVEESDIPDWLKGSLGTTPKVEEKIEEIKEEPKVEEVVEEKISKPKTTKAKTAKVEEKVPETKKTTKPKKEKTEKSEEEVADKKDELWNDGMEVPDWLKPVSDDKKTDEDFWTLDDASSDEDKKA